LTAPSIETRFSWIVAAVSLSLLAFSFGGLWIIAVGLKTIAADTGGSRSVPSLASSLAWLGSAVGGIVMGQIAERVGVRWTVAFGSVSMCIGLILSSFGEPWQLYVGHGLFMGLLGNAGINAPLYVYVSRWFDQHRGSALALISSGSYMAGAIWPMIFEHSIELFGWQQTMFVFGLVQVVIIVPVALTVLRRAPEIPVAAAGTGGASSYRIFGWHPNLVFVVLSIAAFMCCITMSMPQAHLVALCSDLGISPARGAMMLSILLAGGVVCRQIWGAASDRIGGLLTVLASSSLQACAMVAFVFTQDEAGLFTVAGLFGIGFSGIIPAYVLIVRELYPAREAGWRVPGVLLSAGVGMASGGYLGGVIYDFFGYYAPAFAFGVLTNALNLVAVGILVARQRYARSTTRGD
jgi:MFS family permease